VSQPARSFMSRPGVLGGSTAPVLDDELDPEAPSTTTRADGRTSSPRPRFHIVPTRAQRKRRPKIAYAAVVIGGVLAIVITQLMLSVGLSQGAFEIESLQSSQKELDRTNQTLSEQMDKLSSPQNLAAQAETLGMVSNSAPVYLRLSDGAVLGSPAPAAATTTVTGGGNLIANSLLTPAAAAAAGASTDPGASSAASGSADVPWSGTLPSPTTH
jgi:cell division protein FtsB